MSYEAFDKDDIKAQAEDVLALIENLRPHPEARPMSRMKLKLMSAMSGNTELLEMANDATTNTLFWQLHGEVIMQIVTLHETPID
jgi:hypothetical protein